ncbi:possible Zn-containing alcohol dehydrogenase, C-terminal [Rhodococcus jostii RHA1]|uniref:Possible Zn-containing alcohol dehydrogenase, C-terminal n=1 Tax=Rhodococcus jostii (strain RHA1) TaxID=101510 RepID=Q0SKM2_RHOJR|nr:possible Zn-containing alcohol dehydrogenase, C-terminal [Rhodococcus jostii RHA1]
MKAVICTETRLEVGDIPAPIPARGQVLIDVSRCGICGSDLHARVHADAMAELAAETGYRDFMRSHQRVVLGHEFSGTVAGYGPGCRKRWPVGTAVVALPGRSPRDVDTNSYAAVASVADRCSNSIGQI